jgi:hypothetical protein
MVSGIMMAITASDPSPGTGYKTMAAATPQYYMPSSGGTNVVEMPNLPQDLLLDLAKKKGLSIAEQTTANADSILIDSLKKQISSLEKKRQVTKVKWRKVPAPKPIIKTDTIQVPIYYLATQVGKKESPTGKCISVYEVHKVDEICSETTNSSVDGINEYHFKGDN